MSNQQTTVATRDAPNKRNTLINEFAGHLTSPKHGIEYTRAAEVSQMLRHVRCRHVRRALLPALEAKAPAKPLPVRPMVAAWASPRWLLNNSLNKVMLTN